jgi:hypothetical protein
MGISADKDAPQTVEKTREYLVHFLGSCRELQIFHLSHSLFKSKDNGEQGAAA